MSVARVKPLRLFAALLLGVMAALVVVGLGAPATQATPKKHHFKKVVVHPGDSIQEAVDAASPGTTVAVLPGVYRQSVTIKKDGIQLQGIRATLKPPSDGGCKAGSREHSGICVVGRVSNRTGEVTRYVKDVSVSGFAVRNFEGFGIVAVGAENAVFYGNRAIATGEYGIAAFMSTGTRILRNATSGAGEAGIYVGDSPRADATVAGNDTYDNLFGIFVRNARHGKILANYAHDNCVGVLFLADAPGPAGNFKVAANHVVKNSKACPAGEENPPLSGIGVWLWGAQGVKIFGNKILANVPSGPTEFSGGVVVTRGLEGTAPKNNAVVKNTIVKNRPDIFWDGSGTGNRFEGNLCKTSKPNGLCEVKKR